MRIMVTGGAGFIASHLLDGLVAEGHEVIVIDNFFRGKMQNIEIPYRKGLIQLNKTDIRDYASLSEQMKGCDIVFHLAAQSNVLGAVNDTDYSFESNVIGTYHVLKAGRERKIKRLIFTSSREVYGEAQYIPVDEEHPLKAKNFYGASKVAGEKYCEIFREMGYFDVVILRLANVYGKRDCNRVIPIFLENVKMEKNIHIFGGQQLIDFVAIEIVVETLLKSITNQEALSGPTNVGTGVGTTLFELAERIKKLTNSKSEIILEPARSAEVVRFQADMTRFKKNFDINIPADPLFYLSKMI